MIYRIIGVIAVWENERECRVGGWESDRRKDGRENIVKGEDMG